MKSLLLAFVALLALAMLAIKRASAMGAEFFLPAAQESFSDDGDISVQQNEVEELLAIENGLSIYQYARSCACSKAYSSDCKPY